MTARSPATLITLMCAAPLVFGVVLDAVGGNSPNGWGLAFISLALPALVRSFVLRPRKLAAAAHP